MQHFESWFILVVFSAVVFSCAGKFAKESVIHQGPTGSASNTVATTSPISKSNPWNDRLITSGMGTDSVRLGMSRDELVALLGKPHEEYNHTGFCTFSEIHWFPPTNEDGSVDGDGIFAFLKNGKVFELMFGEGFYTSAGIKNDCLLKDLRSKITAPLFELTNSASTATNSENLFFIVEKELGVAYEIAAGYKTRERSVSAIYVFRPGEDFLPRGCRDPNHSFVMISESTNLR